MKKIYFLLILSCLISSAFAQTTTYNYTGGIQTYTVPSGLSSVGIDMAGAQGGNSYATASYGFGGAGGRVQCNLAVSGGEVLYLYVGGVGANGSGSGSGDAAGGYNGGGNGGTDNYGGGGGGASDIRLAGGIAVGTYTTTNRVIVAGGGGGCGAVENICTGGSGGGTTGGIGWMLGGQTSYMCYEGQGGTQSAGGQDGTCESYYGSLGLGGSNTTDPYEYYYSGGGGGGFYGGGCGYYYGGGGGGSSYTATGSGVNTCTNVTHTQGYNGNTSSAPTLNGYITIIGPTLSVTPTTLAFSPVVPGSASAPQFFAITGTNLTGTSIILTPPAGYQISPNGSTWYTSSHPDTFAYTGSSFSSVVFYAEFVPTTTGSASGNITINGGGIPTALTVAVSGTGAAACSGSPTAGSATINGSSTASGNSSTSFTLNAPSATVGGGITYQWQISTTSATAGFSNIPGANTSSYVYTGLPANAWFQCVVTCTGSSSTATTGTVSATFTLPASSCTPNSYTNCTGCGFYVSNGSSYPCIITSSTSTSINDASVALSGTGGSSYYYNNTSMNSTFNPGGTYACTAGGLTTNQISYSVWIDFNNNGSFETSELVGGVAHYNNSSTRATFALAIPSTAPAGAYRMRVEMDYDAGEGPGQDMPYYPCYPSMLPCPTSTGYTYYADTRDYTAIIAPAVPSITGTAVASFGNVTVGTSSVPAGFTTITGANLIPAIGLVNVTAPSNFLISMDGINWVSSLSMVYSSKTLNPTNIYVEFNPTAATSYSGNIAITGGGVPSTVNIAVTGTGVSANCSGTPSTPSASISPSSGGPGTSFSLSLSSTGSSGGLLYQWQSSPTGTVWSNIAGAYSPTYVYSGLLATTQFRCVVTCITSGATATSNTVTATYSASPAASSCVPNSATNCTGCGFYVSNGSTYPCVIPGASGTGINDASVALSGTGGSIYYYNNTSMSVTMSAGGTYTCTAGGLTTNPISWSAWIDFNSNGIFETSELVGGIAHYANSSVRVSFPLAIPATAPGGAYRMRVEMDYDANEGPGQDMPYYPCYPSMLPCPGTNTEYTDTRDYTAIIAPGCSGQPLAGIISAAPTSSCVPFAANLFNIGEPTLAGMTYQWQSSTSPTSGFTNISGATSASYSPSISSVGTVYYRDTVTCVSSGLGAKTTGLGVTLNATPTISGTNNLCSGTTITLTGSPTGGAWNSSAAAATVGSASGVVTGVTGGTTPTISYTVLATGCVATQPITVNVNPSAITGTTTVCGSENTTLSDAATGGVWTSSNAAIATVGGTTGVVTGASGVSGTANITYTAFGGCIATTPVTVLPFSPITGVPSVCIGYSTTLADATTGGTWSSSTPAAATVTSSGIVAAVAVGSTNITYAVSSTGCSATIAVAVTNPPTIYSVVFPGSGSYCSGGSGVPIGLSGSNTGIIYQLYNGTTPVGGTVTGAGFPFTFPVLATGAGSYGVIANPGTACAAFMSGSPVVTVNPLPTQYTVTAGSSGVYCAGGTGVHIYLSGGSTVGVNYQLYSGTTPTGGALPGTGAALDFGLQTGTGPYTVVATNATTACVNNMLGSVTVSINPLPTNTYSITGGGGFCSGLSGVPLGLSGSQSPGFTYQLYNGSTAVGSAVSGTGSAFSFGSTFTTPGTYTVIATNTATGCTSSMVSSTSVVVNSLPTIYTVTGGGAYCSGGTGVAIGLSSSASGTSYQLYNGTTAVGSTVSGTGSPLNFGLFTATGSYTVIATNLTGCVNNMFGSANITINALPTTFSVTQTASSYCAGGTGVGVGLSGSQTGVNYGLYLGTTLVGGASGTSGVISFGLELLAGTYTVQATNATTSCTSPMSGVATIVVNPLPNIETMTSGTPTSYCTGGTGVSVGLTPTQSGVNYQIFNSGVPATSAAIAGTGSAITFAAEPAGTYTSVATNATTGCSSNMSGSIAITANPLPTVYTITGGGNYCTGGTGVHIGLLASNLGISYQPMIGTALIGSAVTGTGGSLDFGLFTTTGTYSVVASNPSTGCTSNMGGSAIVGTSALPAVYSVTGSNSYCSGGLGDTVGVSSSATGVNYQLFSSGSAVGSLVAGTGSNINFGPRTAGTYTVVAINATTACSSNMSGSAIITANPLPTVYNVTGGGNYCAGGTGVHIGLSASATGFTYQVMNGSALSGAPVAGTGAVLDFGPKTGTGSYTVIATNSVTGCTNTMFGSPVVGTTALPTAYAVTGGGNYCFGTPGVPIGLFASTVGTNYQLYIGGASVGSPVTGTGGSLSFGLVTAPGTYNILATNPVTGCSGIMTGSPVVNISALPAAYNVTGGGNYCPGGGGMTVGLDGSNIGTQYQLFVGTSSAGSPVTGTGTPINFGLQTATGIYTVVANTPATTCSNNMTGSVAIAISSLPTAYTVTGGGNYCPGGAGSDIGLSGSSSGTTYQLMNGSTAVGGPVTGTGLPVNFGMQPVTGTYTVVATGTATTCTNNMTGSVMVGLGVLPAVHNLTGGGNYCAGGTGVDIGLNGSDAGNTYQLYNGLTAVGTATAGTGSALDLGFQTAAGVYTIVATSSASTCNATMTGSGTVGISALPTAYMVTGGGNYCSGGTGVHVMLNGSDVGVSYQLFNGTSPVGFTVAGTGGATLDMGLQTATGTYTVVGNSSATTCSNNMAGSTAINIIAPPPAYTVTGGGNFCTGGSGVHVGLSSSNTGVIYQLQIGAGPIGSAMLGTGSSIDFGLQTVSGSYDVVATSLVSGCAGNMTGSVMVNATTLPPLHTVVAVGSNYCAGGVGIDVSLSGSDAAINYELYHGASLVTTIAGTGSAIDFGYQTMPGTYTVVANGGSVSCTRNMSGTAVITVTPLPSVYSVTGGGSYCDGGSGVGIGLSGTDVGVSYQLFNGSTPGATITGTGSAISFGMQTMTGSYVIVATNPSTACTDNMSGAVPVSTNSLPNLYTVTGGGNYCAGGTGSTIDLSGTDAGVSYQLYKGVASVGSPVPGTGSGISFSGVTGSGSYTVVATNTTTTCTNNMIGAVSVVVNPLPTAFSVTGGGNYCAGGGGVHVGISGSHTGINYQLFEGSSTIGSAVPGSGSGLDFGLRTSAGSYTVVATDGSTGCVNHMSGSAVVAVNPLPAVYNVVGGGSYCAEGAGVHIGLNGSNAGINYQLYNSIGASGAAVPGSGGPLDLGLKTAAGTYTVVALNAATGCSGNMAGSATVSITPLVTPGVTVASSGGDTLCAGNFTAFTASVTNGGSTPAYQWMVNGIVGGVGSSYSYIPSNGDNIVVTVTSSAPCATPSTVTSSAMTLVVNSSETPAVSVFADPGNEVCQGQSVSFTATPAYGGKAII